MLFDSKKVIFDLALFGSICLQVGFVQYLIRIRIWYLFFCNFSSHITSTKSVHEIDNMQHAHLVGKLTRIYKAGCALLGM